MREFRTGALVVMGVMGALAVSQGEEAAGDTRDAGPVLAEVRLFAGLTEAERDTLRPAVTLSRGKAGDRVIEQGKRMNRMLIIMKGKAEVRIGGKPVAVLADQPLVGEIEFLEGVVATADVFLQGDALLLELDNAKLNGLFDAHPRVGYLVMREIARLESERLRRMNPK